MTTTTSRTRLSLSLALALPLALGACTDDDAPGATDDDTTGDGDGDTTGDGDGDPTTGDGDGDGDGDSDKPNLGDTPNVLCEAATFNLAKITAENQGANPSPEAIEAAYVDTGLQQFVQMAGAATGRIDGGVLIDDAAILESIELALGGADPRDMLDVEWRVYAIINKYIRREISAVSSALPDPANDPALLYARWDDAYCYWDAALRPLAQLADSVGPASDSTEADIDEGFARGHAGIEGAQPWAIDPWELGPAKQIVEKSTFTMAHRLVAQWSADAASDSNTYAARQAYGAFELIVDRMAGRNTPGIAIVQAALTGDPASIDADDIVKQMNIAFAKRTRKYTSAALPENDNVMGTPEGATGTTEGRIYSKSIEPYMLALPGFDLDAYRQTWDQWIDAVVTDDLPAAQALSVELTDWNCQFQATLGIAECTASADEL